MHNKKWSHKCPSVKERPRESVVFGCLSQQIPGASPLPWDIILNFFFFPQKHEILILCNEVGSVYFNFFKQQLINVSYPGERLRHLSEEPLADLHRFIH